jgi:hypothetical protein
LGKIVESQTLILERFAGNPEPNPVEELKMMRGDDDDSEELDYSNAPTPDYTMDVKIITLKNPTIEGDSGAVFQQFINQVAIKVRELDDEYKKLSQNSLLSKKIYLSQPLESI